MSSRRNDKFYRTCAKIAHAKEKEHGSYNLVQIKAGIKEAAAKDETLLDTDWMISAKVNKWDRLVRAPAKGEQFEFMGEQVVALGDSSRFRLGALSRDQARSWYRVQEKSHLDHLKAFLPLSQFYLETDDAWQPHHKTVEDVRREKFGYVKPEVIIDPIDAPIVTEAADDEEE